MNTITLTQAEFDALPEHHHNHDLPPKKAGTRWKRLALGKWFMGEYVEIGAGIIEIKILEIEVKE